MKFRAHASCFMRLSKEGSPQFPFRQDNLIQKEIFKPFTVSLPDETAFQECLFLHRFLHRSRT